MTQIACQIYDPNYNNDDIYEHFTPKLIPKFRVLRIKKNWNKMLVVDNIYVKLI